MKYNMLKIIQEEESKTYTTKDGYIKFRKRVLVECDCGNRKVVDLNNLKQGFTKSCGCLKEDKFPEVRKKGHDSRKVSNPGIRKLFRNYRSTAKKKNLDFNLSYEEFYSYTQKNCYYCNSEPCLKVKNETGSITDLVNGIDRLDSTKGYIKDNMVSCCSDCNYAKRSMSEKQFKKWIKKVYENLYPEEKGRK